MTKAQLQDLAAALLPELRTEQMTVPGIRGAIEKLDREQADERHAERVAKFAAAGTALSGSASATTRPPPPTPTSPTSTGTRRRIPECYCRLGAAVFTVSNRESPNVGRKFWCCRREREDVDRCRFFAWHDVIAVDLMDAAPTSSAATPSPAATKTASAPRRSNVYETLDQEQDESWLRVGGVTREERLSRAWRPRALTAPSVAEPPPAPVAADDSPQTAVTVEDELEIIGALQRLVMATPRDIAMAAESLERFGGSLSEQDKTAVRGLLETAYWHANSSDMDAAAVP
jgi:hypothetical protein